VIDAGVADGKAGLERRLGDVGMRGGRDGLRAGLWGRRSVWGGEERGIG
jgi:hypothetical protein